MTRAGVGTAAATDARVALLGGLIDHAPTFPPASLPPAAALAEDRRARESAAAFILGRLVWPASRWSDLGDEPRALSAVVDADVPNDPRIEAVELRRRGPDEGLHRLAPEVYVELAVDADLDAELDRLAGAGLRAKVRCGGERVPSVPELARFVRACREAGVVFKATAGLHHAVRTDMGHGFLNLLAAAVFGDDEAALADDDPAAFSVAADSFAWRGRTAGPDELRRARRERLHSIGSCSFFEPVAELEALAML